MGLDTSIRRGSNKNNAKCQVSSPLSRVCRNERKGEIYGQPCHSEICRISHTPTTISGEFMSRGSNALSPQLGPMFRVTPQNANICGGIFPIL